MKKIVLSILAILMAGTIMTGCAISGQTNDSGVDLTPTPGADDKAAFEGSADEILHQLIDATIEKNVVPDEELKNIECYDKPVDNDSCQDILGLTPDEFTAEVEIAVESKPEGAWFSHSIVVIKSKDGIDVDDLADRISKGTNPGRFGCIKAESIIVGYAGQYIILCAGSEATGNAIYSTFAELSEITASRIDRQNDWNDGGLLG